MSHGLVWKLVTSAYRRAGLRVANDAQSRSLLRGQRVYLAGRFARREELRLVAAELERAGAAVTSRWLQVELPLAVDELEPTSRATALAQMDFEDVKRADVCISFTEHPGGPQGRGGRHAELGIALASAQRVIVVGPREHVFHCLARVEHYPTWEQARRELSQARGAVWRKRAQPTATWSARGLSTSSGS